MSLHQVAGVVAAVLFLLAAFWRPGPPKVDIIALGLAFLMVFLLTGAR